MAQTPHDSLFKAVFAHPEHAAAQLAAILPQRLARRADWSTLTLLGGSFVDEALQGRHTDLLFSVLIDGQSVLLYLLFEHQSTVDRWMALRFHVYLGRIWERWRASHPGEPLPLVVPLVVSHAAGGWTAPTTFDSLVNLPPDGSELLAFVPRFSYVVDDLAQASDEALEERLLTSLAHLALVLLRDAREQPMLQVLARARDLFATLEAARTPPHLVGAVLQYVLHNADEIDQDQVVDWIATIGPRTRDEVMRSIAQKLIDDGRSQGRAEGRAEGLRGVLRRQLRLKFSTLDSAQDARIDAADLATLERWADQVLVATSVEGVLGS